MTHSVGRQSGAPFVSGPGATNNVTNNFTGGPWTFVRTNVDSSAETLATWRLDEDASAKIEFLNRSSTNATFAPGMQFTGSASAPTTTFGGAIDTRIQGDSGSLAAHLFHVQTVAGAAIATRPLWTWRNNSNTVLDLIPLNSGANGALSWGTQTGAVPAFTTRSTGTRVILYSAVDATHADNAIGAEAAGAGIWYGLQQASASYYHRWFAGITQLALLDGLGRLFLNANGSAASFRLGQRLAIDASANYAGAAFSTWSTTAGERTLIDINRSKSATVGTHAVVASGDSLGDIVWRGSDGTVFRDAATIASSVDGTPGSGDMPGRLTFWTTPDGSATLAERMRITNAGDVGIGKTPTTGIILDVGGQLGLKSYTVATLPSAAVQAGAIVYASDAGGNGPCLVISNGTNWKRCDNTSTTVT